jgi:hypothetical protein
MRVVGSYLYTSVHIPGFISSSYGRRGIITKQLLSEFGNFLLYNCFEPTTATTWSSVTAKATTTTDSVNDFSLTTNTFYVDDYTTTPTMVALNSST